MNDKNINNQDTYEIDLINLWYLFLEKLKFIIVFALIGAIIAGAYTYFLVPPKYQATSKLYMVSASSDSVVNLTDLQMGTNLTQDYKELILGRPMLESCIKNLKLDMPASQLKSMISISNPSQTRIICITTTTTDKKLSMDIANEMASLSLTWLPEVMEIKNPNLAEEAVMPTTQSSPNMVKNCTIGGIALAAIYFAICVIRFLVDDSIHTAEEFEKYFGVLPFTVIPESKAKKGA